MDCCVKSNHPSAEAVSHNIFISGRGAWTSSSPCAGMHLRYTVGGACGFKTVLAITMSTSEATDQCAVKARVRLNHISYWAKTTKVVHSECASGTNT
ncbi:hypothetical protein EVAR_30599_1 [Eumeta japonica]|uniref:Uncharacterized protein n=1 Tax=Eumeta variegata TaxID=151549 RepID=A0A4C1W8Y0_EUMVA|nr:hypothetical protein EVAR_30599_1 [Eumeta japonica]